VCYTLAMQNGKQFSAPAGIKPEWRVGIVYAPYYKEETESLVKGAQEMLAEAGLAKEKITLHEAPGSWEVPLIGRALAQAGKVDALIGFGIIVQGDTKHADMLADGVVQGMMDVQIRYGVPFAFEVLYVNNLEQARARAFGESNKGKEAAAAVLKTLATIHGIFEVKEEKRVGFRAK
jgi:6,7-dimethyl-8-ribityllumazine synthase